MRLQRLFEMRPAELAFRGRQELFKAVERLAVTDARGRLSCRLDPSVMDASLKALVARSGGSDAPEFDQEMLNLFQERLSRRMFAGLRDGWNHAASRPLLETAFGLQAAPIVARADAVCTRSFDILGYGALSFGRPVRWRLDPVSGRESALVHWSRLDPLAPDQVGDSKVVWELNRHQWALDLGQAYRLTGDRRYADCFIELVLDWLERNPYARGINWSSALEVAMRLISWCWALALFRDSSAVTPQFFGSLLASIQSHAAFVERHLSRYFSPNTHLTVEALGLYYAGTLFPELQGASRWRALGRSVLLEQLPLQVTEDGVYFEQSTRYQYYTVELYLHFAALAARNDDPLPDLVNERLAAMLRFLLSLRRPDGSMPQIGDTDGGWLCPLVRRPVGDFQGLFAAAALILEDSLLAREAGALTPECLALFGARALSDWQKLDKAPPDASKDRPQVPDGYVVMRSGWDREAHQLVFDTGPLGCHVSGGHGHADLLAIQCSAFGENYLVDPGTGCYLADSPWRRHFRSTQAHSTVLVDGRDQAEPNGPFGWKVRPVARLRAAEPAHRPVYADAQHQAYGTPGHPLTHRRRVWFLNNAAWLIVDDLLGDQRHRIDLRFQFAPLPVAETGEDWIRARGRESCLLLRTFAAVELEVEIASGALNPPRGWYSPNYGQWIPAPALTIGADCELPLRLVTLVVPSRDPEGVPPVVEARIEGGSLTGLSCASSDFAFPELASSDSHRFVVRAGS